MGLECGGRHAQKRWAENLRILKTQKLKFEIGPWRLWVKFLPLSWELDLDPLKMLEIFTSRDAPREGGILR